MEYKPITQNSPSYAYAVIRSALMGKEGKTVMPVLYIKRHNFDSYDEAREYYKSVANGLEDVSEVREVVFVDE